MFCVVYQRCVCLSLQGVFDSMQYTEDEEDLQTKVSHVSLF